LELEQWAGFIITKDVCWERTCCRQVSSCQSTKLRVQERFEKEAKTCAYSVKSIHIVRVMDYGVIENGTPFYVMEYLQENSDMCLNLSARF